MRLGLELCHGHGECPRGWQLKAHPHWVCASRAGSWPPVLKGSYVLFLNLTPGLVGGAWELLLTSCLWGVAVGGCVSKAMWLGGLGWPLVVVVVEQCVAGRAVLSQRGSGWWWEAMPSPQGHSRALAGLSWLVVGCMRGGGTWLGLGCRQAAPAVAQSGAACSCSTGAVFGAFAKGPPGVPRPYPHGPPTFWTCSFEWWPLWGLVVGGWGSGQLFMPPIVAYPTRPNSNPLGPKMPSPPHFS